MKAQERLNCGKVLLVTSLTPNPHLWRCCSFSQRCSASVLACCVFDRKGGHPTKNGRKKISVTVRLGDFQHYSLVGEPSERHKIYVASAHSRKSLQLQTEMALMPDDARTLVIDPKGHHAQQILLSLEERGYKLIILDPLGLMGHPKNSTALALCKSVYRHGTRPCLPRLFMNEHLRCSNAYSSTSL